MILMLEFSERMQEHCYSVIDGPSVPTHVTASMSLGSGSLQ